MPAIQPASRGHAAVQEPAKDALQLLMAEHREVKAMFQAYQKLADVGGRGDERMLIASQICVALTLHTQMEEEILYPAARAVLTQDEDIVDEAYVEHAGARALIAQVKTMTSDQPLYDAKLKVLGEYVDHHVREEETEFFPKLRKTALDLEAMGEQIAARKKQLMAQPEPS
ncbi:MAG: hemerythrin domain-containing protein [Pseudomonadota bacterium]|nr:hemerythrin domain-containing protein [Pseudomonadota bacterium]